MTDAANHVVDSRLQEALEQYFNGVLLDRTSGDCAILSGVRKQNGAPVDIYAPAYTVARDDKAVAAMAKDFSTYTKLAHPRLQGAERLLTGRAFRRMPALALLSCPEPVIDDAFDLRPADQRLKVFADVLDGLAALHGAGLVHGALSDRALRREDAEAGLRLCDMTFAGGRKTSVTAQPLAYQSRHVVSTAAPRTEDDVHAAGMLGYRILLGPHGAEAALTGEAAAQDDERLAAAILGEGREAPDAGALFPEGHPASAQIARLLARMTGRLPNATPFSSAAAARRAFASVLAAPGSESTEVATSVAGADTPSRPGPAPAAPPRGVSRGTALTLFAGFLASTAAAVWFYIEADRAEGELAGVITAARTMQAEIDAERAALDSREAGLLASVERAAARAESLEAGLVERDAAQAALRAAAVALAEARVSGAATASDAAAEAYGAARTAFERAEAAIDNGPANVVVSEAGMAGEAAARALDAVTAAFETAAEARQAAEDAAARLSLAAGRSGIAPSGAAALAAAEEAAEARRLAEAAQLWSEAAGAFETSRAALETAAREARSRAEEARAEAADATGDPAFALATSYFTRGNMALSGGALADAATLFDAATRSFDATGAPMASADPKIAPVRLSTKEPGQ